MKRARLKFMVYFVFRVDFGNLHFSQKVKITEETCNNLIFAVLNKSGYGLDIGKSEKTSKSCLVQDW